MSVGISGSLALSALCSRSINTGKPVGLLQPPGRHRHLAPHIRRWIVRQRLEFLEHLGGHLAHLPHAAHAPVARRFIRAVQQFQMKFRRSAPAGSPAATERACGHYFCRRYPSAIFSRAGINAGVNCSLSTRWAARRHQTFGESSSFISSSVVDFCKSNGL